MSLILTDNRLRIKYYILMVPLGWNRPPADGPDFHTSRPDVGMDLYWMNKFGSKRMTECSRRTWKRVCHRADIRFWYSKMDSNVAGQDLLQTWPSATRGWLLIVSLQSAGQTDIKNAPWNVPPIPPIFDLRRELCNSIQFECQYDKTIELTRKSFWAFVLPDGIIRPLKSC